MTADKLTPIRFGIGPTARLVYFSPLEFAPRAELFFQQGYDVAIVTDDDCHVAKGGASACIGEGEIAVVVCANCVADAAAIGFGGGPIVPRCHRAPKLIELKPRAAWTDPTSTVTVITNRVGDWVDALVAVK